MSLKLLTKFLGASHENNSKQASETKPFDGVTIVTAGWILPCASETAQPDLIQNGAIAIQGSKIASVGPLSSVEKQVAEQFPSSNVRKVALSENHIIIPGLINAHTHMAMSLLRGYADDVDLMTWLTQFIWPAEKAVMESDFVYHGTMLAAYEAILSGTTLLNDSYFFPKDAIKALQQAGLRSINAEPILDFGKNDMDNQMKVAEAFINEFYEEPNQKNSLQQCSINPHACYTVPFEYLQKIAAVQKRINTAFPTKPLLCHIHLHESTRERLEYEEKNQMTALEALHKAGLLNDKLIAAHCVHMSPEEIQLFAEAKANVCHCIKSNMKLASGIAPVVQLMEAGINVCLGTDGACSNNSLDMLSEMRAVALVHKAVTGNPLALPAYEVLKMATRNGAKALGRLHDLGTLEVGKLADIVAVDLAGYKQLGLPIYNPISHLLYTSHAMVTDVWIDGRQICKEREILTIHLDHKSAEHILAKLKACRAQAYKDYADSCCTAQPEKAVDSQQ